MLFVPHWRATWSRVFSVYTKNSQCKLMLILELWTYDNALNNIPEFALLLADASSTFNRLFLSYLHHYQAEFFMPRRKWLLNRCLNYMKVNWWKLKWENVNEDEHLLKYMIETFCINCNQLKTHELNLMTMICIQVSKLHSWMTKAIKCDQNYFNFHEQTKSFQSNVNFSIDN